MITFFDLRILISNKDFFKRVITNNYKLHDMRQITKITALLAIIISLASCQSSKSGCYDFGAVNDKVLNHDNADENSTLIFTSVVCKP